MRFTFRPMDETNARAIAVWRYNAPYDLYNPAPDEIEKTVQGFLDPGNAYYAIIDARGELIAYCCFGPDARVPGGSYMSNALDVGTGMRPDLTGQGHGYDLISEILEFARRMFAPSVFRTTVAAFNQRALRVCEKAGFRPVQVFQRGADSRAFVVLMREV